MPQQPEMLFANSNQAKRKCADVTTIYMYICMIWVYIHSTALTNSDCWQKGKVAALLVDLGGVVLQFDWQTKWAKINRANAPNVYTHKHCYTYLYTHCWNLHIFHLYLLRSATLADVLSINGVEKLLEFTKCCRRAEKRAENIWKQYIFILKKISMFIFKMFLQIQKYISKPWKALWQLRFFRNY